MAIINRIMGVLVEKQRTGKWPVTRFQMPESTIAKNATNRVQSSPKNLVAIARILHMDIPTMLVPEKY